MSAAATRAEICVVACADGWRDAGEILVSPFGAVPAIGARLARATFAPQLLLSDGEAALAPGVWPYGEKPPVIEGWVPFRAIFDLVFGGKRHVMMIPTQIDRYGNTNISNIGADYQRPDVQLLGSRGAPGNTVNHPTSYWVPRHTPRAFVPRVDFVSGVGYDSAAAAGPAAQRFMDLRRVVTNLAVLDFGGPDHAMRLLSVQPGVSRAEVVEATGFELAGEAEPPPMRIPSAEELQLIREVIDPRGARESEVPS